MVYTEYFHWQFIVGPRWLLEFIWNVQRALMRLFSVPLMIRTLVAHWHRDVVPYRGGTFSNYAMTFAWNQVSRGIGLIIRSAVLITWMLCEIALLFFATGAVVAFLAWPLLVVVGMITGFIFLVS